jgi:primase-polymerase (primpol)-like protein
VHYVQEQTERLDTMTNTVKTVSIALEIMRDTTTGEVSAAVDVDIKAGNCLAKTLHHVRLAIPERSAAGEMSIDSHQYSSQVSFGLRKEISRFYGLLERTITNQERAFPIE